VTFVRATVRADAWLKRELSTVSVIGESGI
jgi:hypothetical protein